MLKIIFIILIYFVSWGYLWFTEIPQEIFGEQFINDPKVMLALLIFSLAVPLIASAILILTLLDYILPGGIDI